MSIFSLFGSSIKYSQVQHPVPDLDVKRLISQSSVRTLSQNEVSLVEDDILAKKRNGKLSLQRIYEALHSLVNEHKISKNDQSGVMNLFVKYFKEHYGE